MAKKNKKSELDSTRSQRQDIPLSETRSPTSNPQFQQLLAKLPNPTDLIGPYELIRKLGQGGMGEVWLARHTTNRRLVALKRLHRDRFESIERYLLVRREIEAQANLDHPHIVKIVDVSLPALHQEMRQDEILRLLTAEPMYVAFEYVEDARTLGDLIQGEKLEHEQVAELIADVAEALGYAHHQGVYHLDVKPLNILIDRDDRTLLADFGLSVFAGGESGTGTGGTPHYMSPERFDAGQSHDAAGDIWSLGVTFYELLTGERPFPEVKHIKDDQFEYRPIQQCDKDAPPTFIELCDSCLQRDRGMRCQSAEQVAGRLRTWLAARRRPANYKLIGTISVVAALVLVGIGYGVARLTGLVGGVDQRVSGVEQGVAQLERVLDQESDRALTEIQKLYEDPDVLTGKLKSHIRQRAEMEIAGAKANRDDWRKIDEIRRRRDVALDRVDQLVSTIREGLAGDPDPVFSEAARSLAEQGVEDALGLLQERQPSIARRVQAAKSHRDRTQDEFHDSLRPWMMEANLHAQNLAFDKARERYEQVVAEAPDWFGGRKKLGDLLVELAEFEEAERHLKAAFDVANDAQKAAAAAALGKLYVDQARWDEAEPLLKQYIRLTEEQFGPNDPRVATALNNLSPLLHHTNRLAEAEVVMRRALEIRSQAGQPNDASVGAQLMSLGQILMATKRHAEAEPLMRRGLLLHEQTIGPDRVTVAFDLGNLAQVFDDTGQWPASELLTRRALTIFERAYGTQHPQVGILASNLAAMLHQTGRRSAAEVLMRRALDIDEQCHGPKHPNIAIRLNNLALALEATDRDAEAVPLLRRALAIDNQAFAAGHPNIANRAYHLALMVQKTSPAESKMLLDVSKHSVDEVLAQLDKQHRREEKPPIYYLPIDEPISPHIDTMLGPYTLAADPGKTLSRQILELLGPPALPVPGDEPITPHLEKWPSKIQVHWDQPLSNLLEELLGPPELNVPLDQPIGPHLDELSGNVETATGVR